MCDSRDNEWYEDSSPFPYKDFSTILVIEADTNCECLEAIKKSYDLEDSLNIFELVVIPASPWALLAEVIPTKRRNFHHQG